MSFSTDVKNELNLIQIKGNCCKKAYILGILACARVEGDRIDLKLSDPSTVDKFVWLLEGIYKITPERRDCARGCYRASELSFRSASLSEFINNSDGYGGRIDSIVSSFKCKSCTSNYLSAVLCACGTISDPRKSYTLEIRVPNAQRGAMIADIIDRYGITAPCITERKDAVGLFYRNESAIEDMLTACGASKALFTFFDVAVEKNLRNTENRATNCVAKNISKSVTAAAVQISAIEELISNGMFDELPEELKKTAMLRLDNPDVSLTELMTLHVPAISKSGLNHRLARLIEEARKKGLI